MIEPARPELSVVVCSHNGERTLRPALERLQQQTLESSRYEVIVVDDGSTDRTAEIARSHDATVVRLEPSRGLAAARNAGVRASRGAIVAFTDDDCEPSPKWLSAILRSFSSDSLDGIGGQALPACSSAFLLRYLEERNPLTPLSAEFLLSTRLAYRLALYLRNVLRSPPVLQDGADLYSPVGANMAFRREVILDLGGFDEALDFGFEEEDLCRRGHARAQGLRLRYAPEAVVIHRFEPRVGDSLRRARAYGRGHARAAIKDSELRAIVYPFPLLIATVLIVSRIVGRRLPLAIGLLLPLAAYPRWVRYARRIRSPLALAYPLLQLAEELCTMLGEIEGRRIGYASGTSGQSVDS